MDANDFKIRLMEEITKCDEILGIGQTGDIHAPLIAGRSDIDLFILCDHIPDSGRRLSLYAPLDGLYDRLEMEVCSGGVWGSGDIFDVHGIEVMPMYFSASEMQEYVDEVLEGKHLEKEGSFYPVGRLASIETIHILWEKNSAWTDIVDKVRTYPQEFFDKWYSSEAGKMMDEEDLGRAQLRHEVLFYHQVVEEFLDHFLQALYARNRRYFPSRKRTESAISVFARKPQDCYKRLLKIVNLGSDENTIEDSIEELRSLCKEFREL